MTVTSYSQTDLALNLCLADLGSFVTFCGPLDSGLDVDTISFTTFAILYNAGDYVVMVISVQIMGI